MKKTFRASISLLFTSLVILLSCRKPVDSYKPGDGPMPGLSHKYRITASALPGLPNASMANLFAKFDVKNAQNELVVSNKLAAISFNGKFVTEEMELPAGSYRISKLMIVSGTGNVLYAVPVANSVKAAAVNKPLTYNMVLPAPVTFDVTGEFLKVESTDKAVDFGYADEVFNNNTPDENNTSSIRIKLAIKVGDILYDSIPGSLVYRMFSETHELLSVKFISLAAGVNEVQVDKTAEYHDFIVKKWGLDHVKYIRKTELKNDSLYVFGEERAAKKLKYEYTYKWQGSMYIADTKSSFLYNDIGQLTQIEYFQKSEEGTPFLANTEVFDYRNDRVEKISRYDEGTTLTGVTSFDYDASGKIMRMEEGLVNGTKTTVDVSHYPANNDRVSELTMDYSYSHTSLTMKYFQRWKDGNCFSDNSQTSNLNTETGEYEYDSNINPYAHMNWPNLFLSNRSRNNVTKQARTFFGSYPSNLAYSFEYTYDQEGYPMELVRRYKSYLTGQHLFTTKTVYKYY